MTSIVLQAVPLTAERFAPYGDVIESSRIASDGMNDARFDRFGDLCNIDILDGEVAVSIVRSRTPSVLPYRIDMVERHPLGSQAFIPLAPCRMVIVVGPPGEDIVSGDLCAFSSNGHQGINYKRGTWHMPLISLQGKQEFLVIDRGGDGPNCDMHTLDEPVMLASVDDA
jgi:ureidoglycolate lyase